MRTFSREELDMLLDKVMNEIGTEQFSAMRLLEVERLVRSRFQTQRLPGKTLLRETINKFRTARWPQCAPADNEIPNAAELSAVFGSVRRARRVIFSATE
jgi:hypothetical protein